MAKRIYRFSSDQVDGDASMLMLLGGKGANLAEMASINIPVPPGFTITTDACKDFEGMPSDDLPLFLDKLMTEVSEIYVWLTQQLGYPPLVSVRSGAPVSMPGMMDTILNVGMTSQTGPMWEEKIGLRARLDSYRRLIQMLGSTAYGIDMAKFDFQLASVKKQVGVVHDTEMDTDALVKVIQRYQSVFAENTGTSFPDTLEAQLRAAVTAVFRSWMNPRAIEYRKINGIDASMGTAVTIQAMVFGNTGDDSGTGVLFSRDAASGAHTVLGEFLPNAQGEDVVAGIRTPLPLAEMATLWPEQHDQLMAVMDRLEKHYRDMMDLEFTVQNGKLWLLQCRVGKRSALAAFKIAVQFVEAGLITPEEAIKRVTKAQYRLVRRPRIPDSFKEAPHVVGKGASPGVAVGRIVFTSDDAVNSSEPCVLVTHETCPDDIAGMHKAQGILTATGGATSHAAVVARAMDKPCVVGCLGLHLTDGKLLVQATPDVTGLWFHEGDKVTIDGASGRAWFGLDVPVEDSSDDPDVRVMCTWMLAVKQFHLKTDCPQPGLSSQVVMLADLWGNDGGLTELLERIAAEGLAGAVMLDGSPLGGFQQPDDLVLEGCFGTQPMADWGEKALVDALLGGKYDGTLAGLTVFSRKMSADLRAILQKAGYKVAVEMKTLHDLLFADGGVIPDVFVSTVAGSQEAMDELLAMMVATGKSVNALKRAVPLEYAAFAALQ